MVASDPDLMHAVATLAVLTPVPPKVSTANSGARPSAATRTFACRGALGGTFSRRWWDIGISLLAGSAECAARLPAPSLRPMRPRPSCLPTRAGWPVFRGICSAQQPVQGLSQVTVVFWAVPGHYVDRDAVPGRARDVAGHAGC